MEQLLPGLRAAQNIHPFVVHCPVALLPTAFLFCALAVWRRSDRLFAAGRWLLYLGTLGAAFALLSGYQAADMHGHDSPGHDRVHTHRNWMLAASALALISAVLAFLTRNRAAKAMRWILLVLLLATTVVTALGADRGALLVYRYGLGTSRDVLPAPHGTDHHH